MRPADRAPAAQKRNARTAPAPRPDLQERKGAQRPRATREGGAAPGPDRAIEGGSLLPAVTEPPVPDADLRAALAAIRRVLDPGAEVIAVDDHQAFAVHHVQLAMPPGGEPRARAFYGEVLGLAEVPKPRALARRGGVWFRSGALELHVGVEEGFRPARRAHPGILVTDLDALAARLSGHGVRVRPDAGYPGYRRLYTEDPFGNRLEFLQEHARG